MQEKEQEFSFKSLFVPLTTLKAVHLIIFVGFVVFGNALFNGFVWDDVLQIVNNSSIHFFFSFPLFFSQNNFLSGSFYRPIQLTYLAFISTLFGQNVFFFHFFQITLHIINAILVFSLFNKVLQKPVSLFLALIFLVHPIVVESVVYISASSEILCAFFGLLALRIISAASISNVKIILVYLFLLLSILAKETGIIFMVLVVLYQILFKKKIQMIQTSCIVLSIGVYLLLRFLVAHLGYSANQFIPIMNSSFLERLITMPKMVSYYLTTFFFPKDLAISQHWMVTTINFFNFFLPLIFIAVLIFSIIFLIQYLNKYNKSSLTIFIFFTSWFFIAMSIIMQIIPLTMTVADRWFYIPLIGLLGMLGTGLQQIKLKSDVVKTIILISVCICILSLRTIVRNADWVDSFSLYSHDIALSKDSFFLANDLGNEYLQRGQIEESRYYFKQSATIYPYEVNLFNLGLTYAKENDNKKAKFYFRQAVNNYKGYIAYAPLAKLLLINNDPEDAKILIKQGLVKQPNDMMLLIYLGVAEYALGNKDAALQTAQKVHLLYSNQQTEYMLDRIINNLPLQL